MVVMTTMTTALLVTTPVSFLTMGQKKLDPAFTSSQATNLTCLLALSAGRYPKLETMPVLISPKPNTSYTPTSKLQDQQTVCCSGRHPKT